MENYDVRIFGIFKRFIFKIRVHRLIYIWSKIEESILFSKLYLMKLFSCQYFINGYEGNCKRLLNFLKIVM